MKFELVFSGISFHSSMVKRSNSWRFFGDWRFIWSFNSCHRFPKRIRVRTHWKPRQNCDLHFLKSGIHNLDVCLESLCCWKVNRRPKDFSVIDVNFHQGFLYSLQIISLIAINCSVNVFTCVCWHQFQWTRCCCRALWTCQII